MLAPSPEDTVFESAGDAAVEAEARVEFLLRLRARGIRDRAVLNALEAVPRRLFVPHRYADLATKDIALPIPCGQTMPEPFFAGLLVQGLAAESDSRILEIGAGSGFVTALLAKLVREVLSIERYATLAKQAQARLDALGITNAAVVCGDGLAVPAAVGVFDCIVIHGVVAGPPGPLLARLRGERGIVVHARPAESSDGQVLVRAARDGGTDWAETVLGPSRLRPLEAGVPQIL